MKKYLLLGMLALSIGFAAQVYAQEQITADDMVAKMKAGLNLSDDQVSSIKPIVEEGMTKRQELREGMSGTGDRSAIHAQMEELRQDENEKFSKILTPDQMTQWNDMQAQMQSQMHQGGHKHGHHGGDASPSPE